jgi:hypothetical protein
VAFVRDRTIPTERPPLVGDVSGNFLRIEWCRVVSAADNCGRSLGFLDRLVGRCEVELVIGRNNSDKIMLSFKISQWPM